MGGGDGFNSLRNTTAYNILEDKWDELPDLNVPRATSSTFIMNNKFLYTIGGYNSFAKTYSDGIERMNLLTKEKWEIFHIANANEIGWYSYTSFHSIDIGKNKILIFGGSNSMKDVCRKDVFILTIENEIHNVMKVGELPQGSLFYCNSSPAILNKVVYSFDDEKNLSMFFINEQKWVIQRKEDWTKGFIENY